MNLVIKTPESTTNFQHQGEYITNLLWTKSSALIQDTDLPSLRESHRNIEILTAQSMYVFTRISSEFNLILELDSTLSQSRIEFWNRIFNFNKSVRLLLKSICLGSGGWWHSGIELLQVLLTFDFRLWTWTWTWIVTINHLINN